MDNSKAMAIFVKYSQGQNYTPAEAMSRWTEENFGKFHMDFYKGSYIRVMDCDYYYDHWKIEKQSDGMELVTLYLKSGEAKPEHPDGSVEKMTYNSVIALYKSGKLVKVIEGVNPETVFLNEDYSKCGNHCLDFEYKENDNTVREFIELLPENSFRIFPGWMADKVKEIGRKK